MSDSASGAVPQASPVSPAGAVSTRLAANLEALARRFPELAALVAAAVPAPLEISQAASGEPSARGPGGTWLHSSRDPRSEARRIAQAARRAGEDTAVLLGFGLGYVAEALAEPLVPGGSSRAFEKFIACEADPGALRAALEARDLRALLADEALGFVVGGECEALVTALELSGGEKAAILELKAAEESDPAWFEGARQAAERWNAKGAVNANTLKRFGRLWVRNLSRNFAPAASAAGIERLEGLFAGCEKPSPGDAYASPGDAIASAIPAIVLAAGPSLDLSLPYARELSRRALLVCVDTALRSLLRIGLEPDFLVLVDPQYWNWRHVAGLSAPGSFLVSEVAAWPALFRSRFRGTFLGGTLFPLGRRVESFVGRRGMLGAGGSVATSAWDLCRIMGCSPVWMAGLDLGFPEGRTHSRASLFEQRALCEASRLAPASSSQASAFVGGTSFEALAMDGGRLRTDQRMSLYAWWFESRFARPHSPPTISLSPRGLAVPGLSSGAIEELLDGPDIRAAIEERLALAEAMAREAEALAAAGDARERLAQGLADLRSQLASIAEIAAKARGTAREGRQAFASGHDLAPCLTLLAQADEELLGTQARDVAGFLLPSLAEIAGAPARDLGESLAQSEALYARLEESARYHSEALESMGQTG